MKKIFYLLLVFLLCFQYYVECKRTLSGGSNSRSSSSGSSRRVSSNTHTKPSYSYPSSHSVSRPAISHATSRPSISHATNRPAISHATSRPLSHATSRPAVSHATSNNVARPYQDNTRLSYGDTRVQPKPSAPVQSSTINRNQAPPSYTSQNNPSSVSRNQAPPPYSQRPAPGHNTIQSSNYPRQTYHQPGHLPPGAILHSGPPPSGVRQPYQQQGNIPAGARMYQQGNVPAGATMYQPGHLPAGATMYQPGHVPAGATMYQPGHVPAGATMYGGGHHPPPPPMYGGGYHPPPQTTYYQPNQLPPGAVLYSQPPKSSGPGLGTGLVAGAIGGAILGHVLTPTHNHYGSDYHRTSSNYAPPPQSTPDNDKIIIINNGPPGSVTTTGAGSGTTVIENNAGVAPAAVAQGGVAPYAPPMQLQEPAIPLAPFPPYQPGATQEVQNPNTNYNAGVPPAAPAAVAPGGVAPYAPPMQPQEPATPLAPFPPYQPGATQEVQNPNTNNNAGIPVASPIAAASSSAVAMSEPGAANAAMSSNNTIPQQEQGPPPGTIACYPILVNQTDPNDPAKVVQIEQIACYEVPAIPPPSADQQLTSQQTTELLPPQPTQEPDIDIRISEDITKKVSTAQFAENSKIREEDQTGMDGTVLDGQNNQEKIESAKLAEALDHLNKAVEIFKQFDKDQERSNLTAENIWKSVQYYKQMQAERNNLLEMKGLPPISRATSRPPISRATSKPSISQATRIPSINQATRRPSITRATSRPIRPNQDNRRLSSVDTRVQALPSRYPTIPVRENNTISSSSYPRQTYYPPGHLPSGAILHPGPPPYNQPVHIPSGSITPVGGPVYHPPSSPIYQPPPQIIYYQPNQLPPGAVLYPQPPKKSGPGLGTGLVAGAIGGAILGHILTPTHQYHTSDYHHTSTKNSPAPQSTPDNDRIIIINNGPPGSVTTIGTGSGTTVIDNNAGVAQVAPAAAAPVAPGGVPPYVPPMTPQEPPTPLAPFPPYQPGTTQEVQNPNMNDNAGRLDAAASSSPVAMSEPGAVNSPIASNDTNTQQEQGPPPGTIACYPILINQTDPNDPTKVIEIEQIACYEVPANPPSSAEQQLTPQQTIELLPQQPTHQTDIYVRTLEDITQQNSTAQFDENSKIKEEDQTGKNDALLQDQINKEKNEFTKLAEALDYLNRAVEIFKQFDKDQERSNLTAENIWKSVIYYKQIHDEQNNVEQINGL